MKDKVENSFRDILSALQIVKMYTASHPVAKKAVEKAFLSLQEILKERDELVIGIIGEELAFQKEILFDLSKMAKPIILYLKERGIERIGFSSHMSLDELNKFIGFMAASQEGLKGGDIQEHLTNLGVNNITVGKLKGTVAQGAGDSDKLSVLGLGVMNYLNLYENSLDILSLSVGKIMNAEALDALNLKSSVNNCLEGLSGSRCEELLQTAAFKRYDLETYSHLLNVGILAMYFSSRLGFSREDVSDIGMAALLHDIGKLYISQNILKKSQRLEEQELDQVKSHTILGAEILLKYADAIGIMPVVVAFEHHLKYDSSGYPKFPFLRKPHTASLIVSLCDVYDALLQRRGYKVDYSPDLIYNVMQREKGKSFDPELLDKFFNIMGVWPLGALLLLNESRVAVVREQNADDIFLPKVEVIYPEDKKESIDLKEKKDSVRIERYLSPWKEGKDYLPLLKSRAKRA